MAAAGADAFDPSAWIYDPAKFKHLAAPEQGTLYVRSRITGELGSYCPATGHLALKPLAVWEGCEDNAGRAGSPARRVTFAEDLERERSTALSEVGDDSRDSEMHWRPPLVELAADLVFEPYAAERVVSYLEDSKAQWKPAFVDLSCLGDRLAPAACVYHDFDRLACECESLFVFNVANLDDNLVAHLYDNISV